MLTAQLSFKSNDMVLNQLLMPHGFIGFEEYQHYTISPFFEDQTHNAFWHLKSMDYPDLSFVLMGLDNLKIKDVQIREEDLELYCQDLGIKLDEIYIFLVVTFSRQEEGHISVSVNTRAPWIYHPLTRQAWQVVLPNSHYPIALEIS